MSKKKMFWLVLATVALAMVLWVVYGNTTVGLTRITVQEENLPAEFDGYRIAHISDLHNSWLWEKAIDKLKEAQPHIIVITGDMVDWKRTDVDAALSFAREALTIAPCYYITGNHEVKMPQNDCAQLLTGLDSLGVTILDDSTILLQHNGSQLALAGHSWGSGVDLATLTDYEGYRILLHHQPEGLEDFAEAGYDLVFSGHAHGGQVRLPFIGGLWAPNQGLFPPYDSGHYALGNTDLIVSRGIGNSSFPIRFYNQPEVILVQLKAG